MFTLEKIKEDRAPEVIRFHYCPMEDEDGCGTDVFIRMALPPLTSAERGNAIAAIEDAICSYIDAVGSYSFEELAIEIARSFDPKAEIVELTTFTI